MWARQLRILLRAHLGRCVASRLRAWASACCEAPHLEHRRLLPERAEEGGLCRAPAQTGNFEGADAAPALQNPGPGRWTLLPAGPHPRHPAVLAERRRLSP